MNINSNSYLQNSTLQSLSSSLKSNAVRQLNDSADALQPASLKVTLSNQAQELSKVSKVEGVKGRDSETRTFLEDVFRGVKEQLSSAPEAGKNGASAITKAGEAFEKQLQEIISQIKGGVLSDSQVEQIAKADDKFHQVVDKSYGRDVNVINAGGGQSGNALNGSNAIASNSGGAQVDTGGTQGSSKSRKNLPNDLNKDGKVSASELIKAQQKQLLNQITSIFKGSASGQSVNLQA